MTAVPADEIPEPDRLPGAPHPRQADRVLGQDGAVAEFLAAAAQGRLHHGWLLSGPRGTGKATLGWAMARWLLAGGRPGDIGPDPASPVLRRMRALSEPRLHLVRRPFDERAGRLRTEITVDEIRRLQGFFHLSAAEGGRRVAIIDAADEMNSAAANALLKQLEEPPRDATLILIAHQPARLLPTIRSRCRELRLHPLAPDALKEILSGLGITGDAARLAALADGSAGEAVRLAAQDGLATYQRIVALFEGFPGMDRVAMQALADAAGGRPQGGADPFELAVTLLERFLSRAARAGLLGPPLPEAAEGEAALLARLSPDARAARHWADALARLSARARQGRAVNLDPSALVMDMLVALASEPVA